MLNFNSPNLARRLTKIASAVGMAETRIAVACDDLRLYASHVPEVAEALQYLEPAARFLEPLFDELHKIINDPACAGSTLSDGVEGQQPPESGQGPAADTQSTSEHKPGSAVSLSTVLAQFLTVADESQPESESWFDSERPVFAQVASLTEQVKTLQDDVKMLVEICRSQQNQLKLLKLLKEAVLTNANSSKRKVAIGN